MKTEKTPKINCPVCQEALKHKLEKKHEIIVCPSCDNSLFMYRSNKILMAYPFSLNAGIKGNKFLSDEEFDSEGSMGDFDPESDEDGEEYD